MKIEYDCPSSLGPDGEQTTMGSSPICIFRAHQWVCGSYELNPYDEPYARMLNDGFQNNMPFGYGRGTFYLSLVTESINF